MEQHERGQGLHAKFCHNRRKGGWVAKPPPKVPNFIKIAVLASIFCCQVRDYVPIMLQFGTKQSTVGVLSHAKFEPNQWQKSLYRCPQIYTFGQIWSFSTFYHQSAGQTCKKINVTLFAVTGVLYSQTYYVFTRHWLTTVWGLPLLILIL